MFFCGLGGVTDNINDGCISVRSTCPGTWTHGLDQNIKMEVEMYNQHI